MNKENILRKRNDTARLLRLNEMGKRNAIYTGENEGDEHAKTKFEVCRALTKLKKEFYTEGVFKNGMRCDVLDLDDGCAIEIMDSEEAESIEFKKQNYPCRIVTIKAGEKFKEEMIG